MSSLPDAVRALLDAPNYAHVATVLPDGGPHSVPVWVGLEGHRIAFLTHPASRKARNLEHDPRVAISVTAHDRPYAMAQVLGRVAVQALGHAATHLCHRVRLVAIRNGDRHARVALKVAGFA